MPTQSTTFFFFFNDTATTEIYTLSLHDALPICPSISDSRAAAQGDLCPAPAPFHPSRNKSRESACPNTFAARRMERSEEHTSELQSRQYLVCRLLLEKKKNNTDRLSNDIGYHG